MVSSSLLVGLLLCFVPTPRVALVPGLSSDFRKAPTCLHLTGQLRAVLVTGGGGKSLRLSWISDVCHWHGAERGAAGFATSGVASWAPRALDRATPSRPAHTRRSAPGVGGVRECRGGLPVPPHCHWQGQVPGGSKGRVLAAPASLLLSTWAYPQEIKRAVYLPGHPV